MEIEKQQETYLISDTVAESGWEMVGSANLQTNGSLNISFTVTKPGELTENVGDCNYFKDGETNMTNISYNVSEATRDAFTQYIDTVVDTVTTHFSE